MSPAESGVWKACEWLHGLESNLCAMLLSIEIGGPLCRVPDTRGSTYVQWADHKCID